MLIGEAATFVNYSSVLFRREEDLFLNSSILPVYSMSFLLSEVRDRSNENYRNFLQDRVIPCQTKTLFFSFTGITLIVRERYANNVTLVYKYTELNISMMTPNLINLYLTDIPQTNVPDMRISFDNHAGRPK